MSNNKQSKVVPAVKTTTVQSERGKNVILNLIRPTDYVKPLTISFDIRSQMGQFGWETIGDVHVPYIFRVLSFQTFYPTASIRYIALRIVNQQVLRCFFNVFKQELFDLLEIPSYQMSDAERKTYNEINFGHCDSSYGLNSFQKDEQLLRLDDVAQIFEFLAFLKQRLVTNVPITHQKFGYISINGSTNLVPFYKLGSTVFLPVLFFEGDENNLRTKSVNIPTAAENIVRVLIKMQNILSEEIKPMPFISLDNIRVYFENTSKFNQCWLYFKSEKYLNATKANECSILKVQRCTNDRSLVQKSTNGLQKYNLSINGNPVMQNLCDPPQPNNVMTIFVQSPPQ